MDYLRWLLEEFKQRSDIDQQQRARRLHRALLPAGRRVLANDDVVGDAAAPQPLDALAVGSELHRRDLDQRIACSSCRACAAWVNTYYYSGTPIGITEYNWGAESHINGATTQADIYGIFGREGLDMGARWTTPATTTPTYKAMKMYRNYDGNRSTFGETSVRATSTANADNLSVFAAERASDGALTVMVIAKVLSGATPVTINLPNFAPGSVRAGVAADLDKRDHPSGRSHGDRAVADGQRACAERHAVRDSDRRRASESAAGGQLHRDAGVGHCPAAP